MHHRQCNSVQPHNESVQLKLLLRPSQKPSMHVLEIRGHRTRGNSSFNIGHVGRPCIALITRRGLIGASRAQENQKTNHLDAFRINMP